ncbi:SWIM zinc finger family protein [Oscillatoria sp. FACHB-1407]|uniref:SWIM zinc finger family protein n=1 Tax=Oscillatoria sp. FACHB-1407 TaxID=2692847 RepID=UPI00168996E4|nr:SWIM zinc finger family protein [Oscillatoria sp. FACHB-1407]MBD2464670.1 SWIM zinc finger family protein [Oscillatoria sp. FACHB-1407]
MPSQWTSEQVLALAPDAASAKNGRGLATLRKWSSLGCSSSVVWGECQGSGNDPYRTQIDVSEPAFRCSCPSRKFPCKHGLGLFLLLAEQANEFAETEPPAWVAEWVLSRSQRAEKQAAKQAKQQEQVADPTAQAKRAAARQHKVSLGIQDLRLWLEDRVRQGLATVQQEAYQVWDTVAARMVDAQAPGLARQLREMAGLANLSAGGHARLLERLGQLYLITEGFQHIDSLPLEVQADLRTQIGWTVSQDEVFNRKPHSDLWLVVGQRTEVEDRLRIRRTWLLGIGTATFALLLDFAHGQQPFEHSFLSGTCLEAELVFYPSAYPLRALIKTRQEAVLLSKQPPGKTTIAEAIATYSHAFAVCPWLEQFPLLLQAVVPFREGDHWLIQDAQGAVLPLSNRLEPRQAWQLLALSGGTPLTIFGEWNGDDLLPLNVWMEESLYGLG